MPSLGTRTTSRFSNNVSSRSFGLSTNRDPGKLSASGSFTFTGGQLTAPNGTFFGFETEFTILVQGSLLNAGPFLIVGVDAVNAAYLTLDPPPKNEGPIQISVLIP